MKNEDANKPLKYKLVAPEGGWGYMVALATAVIVVNIFYTKIIILKFMSIVPDIIIERNCTTNVCLWFSLRKLPENNWR